MAQEDDLKLLLNEVFKERGIDFSQYREKLIERRIAVRLRATKSNSYEEYLDFLRGNKEEMEELLDALTIHVTAFFRDKPVFEAIRTKIIPEIFNQEVINNKKLVRIWSCGCSSGQEATSIMMLIAQYLKENLDKPRIYIYSTDIDKWSIEQAKDGVYDAYELRNMPVNLRNEYFLDMGNNRFWRKKEWNKYFIFKVHDVIKDPPLRNVDLILCRNLFIYFKRELQELCLRKFYESLNKDGFLVLGLTESLWGDLASDFIELDWENRIYKK